MLRSYPVREHYKNSNARLLVMQKRPPVSLCDPHDRWQKVQHRQFTDGFHDVKRWALFATTGAPLVGCTTLVQREQRMSHDHHEHAPKWKHDGVRVIPGHTLDPNTPQTLGMERKAAINFARVGAQKIWAGTVNIQPNAKTGPHHHGELESVIYVVRGKARMRWGDHLEFVAEANPGDFIYVPPFVPHQEINANQNEPLECVLVRSDNEAVVVNLDIEPIEKPEQVAWIDPIHKG